MDEHDGRVHEVARAIRDAYEYVPGRGPGDFTDVHEWYPEARAAIEAIERWETDGGARAPEPQ